MSNKSLVKKIDYVELYVTNIIQAIYFYQKAFGFKTLSYSNLEDNDRISTILVQGEIKLILTSTKNREDKITEQIDLHGDFVKDIALEVKGIEKLYNQAINNGFKSIALPKELVFDNRVIKTAIISTFGNVQHTLIERFDNDFILPGYPNIKVNYTNSNIDKIDHIAFAVDELKKWEELYKQGLNFYRFYQETIKTEHSGMDSVVINSPNDAVKCVFVSPKKGSWKSQIEKFLDYNNDCGVQHLALSTGNILDTITQLKENNVEFLPIPDDYYENLSTGLKEKFKTKITLIKKLKILLDKDEYGYLLQIFTKPLQTRPTFFLEIIERQGANSFGKNNIMALFRAIEKQLGK